MHPERIDAGECADQIADVGAVEPVAQTLADRLGNS
jgi:hypothetical protein